MSRHDIIAKRYAKALFEAALERKIVAEVDQELKVIVGIFVTDENFRKFLEHPNIDNSNKTDVLSNVLENKVSDLVFNTLKLLITRGRESILPSLYQSYIAVANEALGQANAIVYTPHALSAKESQAIASKFGKITGKTIQVENVLEENLLGGLRVRIGDRLYDGSLLGKLTSLEKSLQQKAL